MSIYHLYLFTSFRATMILVLKIYLKEATTNVLIKFNKICMITVTGGTLLTNTLIEQSILIRKYLDYNSDNVTLHT